MSGKMAGAVAGAMVDAAGSVRAGAAGNPAAGNPGAAAAEACASRSWEVRLLAARVADCADRADAALAQLAWLELQSWQSPAGQAYRTALSLQAASLRRSRDALHDAAAAVLRHAGNVMLSPGRAGY